MFFRKKQGEYYHPANMATRTNWYMCHVTFGAKKYKDLGQPTGFNADIAPAWYTQLTEDEANEVSDKQEEYAKKLLEWVTSSGVEDAFISGADEEREKKLLAPYNVPNVGHFNWLKGLEQIIPTLNIYNFYLKAKDDAMLVIYESDTETLFVNDIHNHLPAALKHPQVAESEVKH